MLSRIEYGKDLRDFVWKNVLPYICLVGIFTNAINFSIFSRIKSKNTIYKFFILHSAADFVYFLLSFVYFFLKYSLKMPSCSYIVNVIDLYLFSISTTALAFYLLLVEIMIAFKRLLIVLNLNQNVRVNFKSSTIVILFFSILTQVPYMLTREIRTIQTNNSSEQSISDKLSCSVDSRFEIERNAIYDTRSYRYASSFINLFRGVIAPAALLSLNILLCYKYKREIRL